MSPSTPLPVPVVAASLIIFNLSTTWPVSASIFTFQWEIFGEVVIISMLYTYLFFSPSISTLLVLMTSLFKFLAFWRSIFIASKALSVALSLLIDTLFVGWTFLASVSPLPRTTLPSLFVWTFTSLSGAYVLPTFGCNV